MNADNRSALAVIGLGALTGILAGVISVTLTACAGTHKPSEVAPQVVRILAEDCAELARMHGAEGEQIAKACDTAADAAPLLRIVLEQTVGKPGRQQQDASAEDAGSED